MRITRKKQAEMDDEIIEIWILHDSLIWYPNGSEDKDRNTQIRTVCVVN
jgi:hypothetical protein